MKGRGGREAKSKEPNLNIGRPGAPSALSKFLDGETAPRTQISKNASMTKRLRHEYSATKPRSAPFIPTFVVTSNSHRIHSQPNAKLRIQDGNI